MEDKVIFSEKIIGMMRKKHVGFMAIVLSLILADFTAVSQNKTITAPAAPQKQERIQPKKQCSTQPAKPVIPQPKAAPISPAQGYVGGHGYVDLGLSVMWATCNVGAVNPENRGGLFSWSNDSFIVYAATSNDTISTGKVVYSNVDAVSLYWPGLWQKPTKEQVEELVDKCYWNWEQLNGVWGFGVTGPNGNAIFIPYTYSYIPLGTYDEKSAYWSDFQYSDGRVYAISFDMVDKDVRCRYVDAYVGASIRPVLKKEYETFIESLTRAYAGDGQARYDVGNTILSGQIPGMGLDEARIWLELAAQDGIIDAFYTLAEAYEHERIPSSKSLEKAEMWYAKLYQMGYGDVKRKLSYIRFEIAMQYDRNDSERGTAFSWFEKAASLGNAEALNKMGEYYAVGIGTPFDLVTSFQCYMQAAILGCADAMASVGECYLFGKGVAEDRSKALEWYRKAADNGSTRAADMLKTLEENGISFNDMQNNGDVFFAVEKEPEFPGGNEALMKYLSKNIKYPENARDSNIQGQVVVQFVVTKTGQVGFIEVVKSVDPLLDAEAVRVCKSLPRFTPGTINGNPVSVWYTLPVNFLLANGSKPSAKDKLKSFESKMKNKLETFVNKIRQL